MLTDNQSLQSHACCPSLSGSLNLYQSMMAEESRGTSTFHSASSEESYDSETKLGDWTKVGAGYIKAVEGSPVKLWKSAGFRLVEAGTR